MNRNVDQDSYNKLKEALAQIDAPRPPADLATRCLSTISARQNTNEFANTGSKSATSRFALGWLLGRQGMRHRELNGRFAWAAASLTVACTAGAVVSILLFTPGSPLHPTPAFSEFYAAMRSIHTAHWTESITILDLQGHASTTCKEEWIRLDPPALSETSLPPKRQVPSAGSSELGVRMVMDAKNQLLYFPPESHSALGHKSRRSNGRYFRVRNWPQSTIGLNNSNPIAALQQFFLGKLVVPSLAAPSPTALAALGPGQGIDYLGSQWSARSATLAGRNVTLFERKGIASTTRQGEGSIRIWADSITHRVLRREQRQTGRSVQGRMQVLSVGENFHYDETPPAGIFDLTPPPGVAVTDMGGPASIVWNQVPKADRKMIQATIDTSEDGWREGDFMHFASAWDFDYLAVHDNRNDSGRARRQAWKIRATNQRGRWSQWQSQVEAGMKSIASGLVTVRVRSQGQWRENGDSWQGEAEYELRHDKKGWRIVDWQHQSLWDSILAEHYNKTRRTEVPTTTGK